MASQHRAPLGTALPRPNWHFRSGQGRMWPSRPEGCAYSFYLHKHRIQGSREVAINRFVNVRKTAGSCASLSSWPAFSQPQALRAQVGLDTSWPPAGSTLERVGQSALALGSVQIRGSKGVGHCVWPVSCTGGDPPTPPGQTRAERDSPLPKAPVHLPGCPVPSPGQ